MGFKSQQKQVWRSIVELIIQKLLLRPPILKENVYLDIVWYNFQAGIVFKTLMPKYKILHLAYLTKWNSHLLLISSDMSTCSYRMSIVIMTRISKINKGNFHTN